MIESAGVNQTMSTDVQKSHFFNEFVSLAAGIIGAMKGDKIPWKEMLFFVREETQKTADFIW